MGLTRFPEDFMKKFLIFLLTACLFISCSQDAADSGLVTFNITDAPVSTEGLTAVYITISEVLVKVADSDDWLSLVTFDEGLKLNLLDLTEGKTANLADSVELPSGRVNQIRLMLDAPVDQEAVPANPGCYLVIDDVKHPLWVPSGSESGFKLVNSFTIPVNGEVTVTADFDIRKSLVLSGEVYKLKPAVRVIVDGEAGQISGELTGAQTLAGSEGYSNFVVYAYEPGGDISGEAVENADGIQFPNAVTSTFACPVDGNEEDLRYKLAFLAEGSYDLIVAAYKTVDEILEVVTTVSGVQVESGETTNQDIPVQEATVQ